MPDTNTHPEQESLRKESIKPSLMDIVQLVRRHYRESMHLEMGYAKAAQIVDEAIALHTAQAVREALKNVPQTDMVIGDETVRITLKSQLDNYIAELTQERSKDAKDQIPLEE